MLILALDTCDADGSLALLRHQEVLSTEVHSSDEDYSSWLPPATRRLLGAQRIALNSIDLLAAAAGPGSFTGVRVGLTSVKAWSELFSIRIASVSRLQALAEESSGRAEYIAAFFNARRNQVFGALYRRQSQFTPRAEEALIAPEDFVAECVRQAGSASIDWISPHPACLTETAIWSKQAEKGESVQTFQGPLAPRIGQIGLNMANENRLTDALHLDANYIRRSDAELYWKGLAHGA